MNAAILAFLMAFISTNTEGAVELTHESIFSLVLLTNSIIALSAFSEPSITLVNVFASLFRLSKSIISESSIFSLSLLFLIIKGHSQIIIMIHRLHRINTSTHTISWLSNYNNVLLLSCLSVNFDGRSNSLHLRILQKN